MLPLSSYFPIASAALERPWTPADPEGKYVVGWHVSDAAAVGWQRRSVAIIRLGNKQSVVLGHLSLAPLSPALSFRPNTLSLRSPYPKPPHSLCPNAPALSSPPPHSLLSPSPSISMVIAENRLMSETFRERWRETLVSSYSPSSAASPSAAAAGPALDSLYYQDFRGTLPLRQALAGFMSRHVARRHAVEADDLIVGNGCGSCLDTLFHLLCDEGDACLLPAPLYPTFINDLESRAKVHVQVVPTEREHAHFPTPAALEAAYAEASAKGHAPRVILLTNPTNPLGTVWPAEAVRGAMEWAVDKGMHVVADEIYAASVFGEGLDAGRESAWDLAAELGGTKEGGEGVKDGAAAAAAAAAAATAAAAAVGSSSLSSSLSSGVAAQSVHVVYGLSKDFGISGFRVGAVATRNEAIKTAWGSNLGYMTTVPGVVQEGLASILSDEEWVDQFLADNRAALHSSFTGLTEALGAEGVPVWGGGAAMFAWLDLRAALPKEGATFDDERRAYTTPRSSRILGRTRG